ncbi:hypothetical protein MKZ38_001500 [Zalerion maritima]|uniref:Uncharacterized protein n=1 Tax=Zalerion maritima TaxID=339359 RepID=A0AAD5RFE2_9PEZI|nr:hypothetical protein MKZ38_001500 [Zalerion maritima]
MYSRLAGIDGMFGHGSSAVREPSSLATGSARQFDVYRLPSTPLRRSGCYRSAEDHPQPWFSSHVLVDHHGASSASNTSTQTAIALAGASGYDGLRKQAFLSDPRLPADSVPRWNFGSPLPTTSRRQRSEKKKTSSLGFGASYRAGWAWAWAAKALNW